MTEKQAEAIVQVARALVIGAQILGPVLEDMRNKGVISVERQQQLEREMDQIRSGEAFKASHWQKPTETGA